MTKKKQTALFIISAVFFAICLIAFIVCYSKANSSVDLGFAKDKYNVSRFNEDSDGNSVIGTTDGDLVALNKKGEVVWEVGGLSESRVLDIAFDNGKVYSVFASGDIYSFNVADAVSFTASETTESFIDVYPVKQYSVGYQLDTGANCLNTQLAVSSYSNIFYLRCAIREVAFINRIFSFQKGATECVEVVKSVAAINGITLDNDGTMFYSCENILYKYYHEEVIPFTEFPEKVLALSSQSDYVSAICSDGRIYHIDRTSALWAWYDFGNEIDAFTVMSAKNTIWAKLKSGGFVAYDLNELYPKMEVGSSYYETPVFWSDNAIAFSDQENLQNYKLYYYDSAFVDSASVLSVVSYVLLGLTLIALILTVYRLCCVCSKDVTAPRRAVVNFFKSVWKNRVIYICLAVPFALLTVFYFIPIIFSFKMSFSDYIPGQKSVFVGFENFIAVVNTPSFWSSAKTMLIFLGADLLKALIPPLIIAECIFALKNKRLAYWIRVLLFIPGIMPGVAASLVWMNGIFDPSNGLMTGILKYFDPTVSTYYWLNSEQYSTRMFSIIAFGLPWVGAYLIFYGALGGISNSLFEAAELDGCSWRKRFFKIDLPLIFPQLKYIFITSFIASVQNYGTLVVVYGYNAGSNALQTPALLMYSDIMNGKYGTASAMGVIIFLFLITVAAFNFKSQLKDEQ